MAEPSTNDDIDVFEALLHQMTVQREAYLETSAQIEALLAQHLTSRRRRTLSSSSEKLTAKSRDGRPSTPNSQQMAVTKSAADPVTSREVRGRQSSAGPSTFVSDTDSRWTALTDDETDEILYVTIPLETQQYDHEDFRDHLRSYDWDDAAREILETVVDQPDRMSWPFLFPADKAVNLDRSNYTHCQVFDVGPDGAPVPTYDSRNEDTSIRAISVWNTIKSINPPNRQTPAVGRITILREPSPVLFGAAHFTTHQVFDTDELFRYLVDEKPSAAHMHRAFEEDPRRQSSFVFSFEYFTIIGDVCKPMHWQLSDRQPERKPKHIPITRCSAVVALSLNSTPVRKMRNPSRRASSMYGYVYDVWAPWHVLNIQAFADWNASTDTHDSTKHYVNGVEAFMTTLLAEYTDAETRLEQIYREISTLITPPLVFMFDAQLRDQLLFEDSDFTYSRRYFWAYQTCGIMIDSLKSLIDAYEDTFTDEVWEGRHRTLWPLIDQESARSKYFKKRMAALRRKFEVEMRKLKKLMAEFHDRRRDIIGLRDQLFSGTSVLESRKSVDMAETTVQQGHNIKLLTLVSIFFLPLTFVTSVFGMTTMPTDGRFGHFTIALVTICIPFFILVGSLNSTRVMKFWLNKIKDGTMAAGRLMKRVDYRLSRRRAKISDAENESEVNGSRDTNVASVPATQQPKWRGTTEVAEMDRSIEQRWRHRGSIADRGSISAQDRCQNAAG